MRPVDLPEPSPLARDASERLRALIVERIAQAGGWIGFDRYMDAALYEPGLGYYAGGAYKFGPEGDFVTAPEISPLFGECLAGQCLQWFEQAPRAIFEFGAGSGALAVQLLRELDRLGAGDVEYRIVEVSAALRERQRAALESLPAALSSRVAWLDRWPEAIDGVVIGNELLDAMPARMFLLDRGRVLERGVAVDDGRLAFADREPDAGFDRQVRALLAQAWGGESGWPDAYVSEVGERACAWVREAGRRLQRGALLLLDYGFPRAEFYHPQRSAGTLMCHYRHFSLGDPFRLPGLQDITVHVDFSAVAEAAREAGLDCLGYTSQAHLLMNLGLLDRLARVPADEVSRYLPQAQAVKRLLSEAEMGELVKAAAFGRGVDDDALGFGRGDRRGAL